MIYSQLCDWKTDSFIYSTIDTATDPQSSEYHPPVVWLPFWLPSMVWSLETAYDVINQHLLYAGYMQSTVSFGAQSGDSEPGK